MAEEKKEKWVNWVALTTVALAVCATLSTFKGGQYSTRSVMSQSQATNQWSYYQAKSIKGYIYEGQKEAVEADLKKQGDSLPPELKQSFQDKIAAYNDKLKRYDQEKAEIFKEAKRLEEVRDLAQQHSQTFGMALIFLQIGILLSSISALLKKQPLWLLGMGVGAAGLVYFANGFLLFF
ncbi:MAG: DUF4337 domain-containing protein [Desulfarculus sp.]|nr:DUF4337 domain-containing protein [Desulfarculus sp.]